MENVNDKIFNIFNSLVNVESTLNIMYKSMEDKPSILNVEDYMNMICLVKSQIRAQINSIDSLDIGA